MVYKESNSLFASPVAPGFSSASIGVSSTGLNYVDITYTFSFSCPVDLPAFSSLLIDFPDGYSLLSSDPKPYALHPSFTDASSTHQVTALVTNQQVTISNIGAINKGVAF